MTEGCNRLKRSGSSLPITIGKGGGFAKGEDGGFKT